MASSRRVVRPTDQLDYEYSVYVNTNRHAGKSHNYYLAAATQDCEASLVEALATSQDDSIINVAPRTFTLYDSAVIKNKSICITCTGGMATIHGVGCIPLIVAGPEPSAPVFSNISVTAESASTHDTTLAWLEMEHWGHGGWLLKKPLALKKVQKLAFQRTLETHLSSSSQ